MSWALDDSSASWGGRTPYRCQWFCVRSAVGHIDHRQAHSEDAEFSQFFFKDHPLNSSNRSVHSSVIHSIRNMDSRSAPVEVPPSESATIPFIQCLVGSSSPLIQNSSQHSWSPKIVYYIVHMVESPGEEGLRYERGMDTLLYLYQVQNYQPQKKA